MYMYHIHVYMIHTCLCMYVLVCIIFRNWLMCSALINMCLYASIDYIKLYKINIIYIQV